MFRGVRLACGRAQGEVGFAGAVACARVRPILTGVVMARLRRDGLRKQLFLAALAWSSSAALADTANWLNAVNGNWTDASKWSTNPAYPNNGTPAGANYDV